MKPDEKTLEILDNIQTEIGAGMVLLPRSPAEHAHNNACERANTIIQNYADGIGLFQMTRDMAQTQRKINARVEALNVVLPDPSAVSAPAEAPEQSTRALDSTPGRSVRKRQGTARKAR
jgi:hypothetical protein